MQWTVRGDHELLVSPQTRALCRAVFLQRLPRTDGLQAQCCHLMLGDPWG